MQNATPITKARSRTSKAAKNAEPNAAVPADEATTDEATTDEATTDEATTDEARTSRGRPALPRSRPPLSICRLSSGSSPRSASPLAAPSRRRRRASIPTATSRGTLGSPAHGTWPAAWVPSWPSGELFTTRMRPGVPYRAPVRVTLGSPRRPEPTGRAHWVYVPTTQHSPPASRCSPACAGRVGPGHRHAFLTRGRSALTRGRSALTRGRIRLPLPGQRSDRGRRGAHKGIVGLPGLLSLDTE